MAVMTPYLTVLGPRHVYNEPIPKHVYMNPFQGMSTMNPYLTDRGPSHGCIMTPYLAVLGSGRDGGRLSPRTAGYCTDPEQKEHTQHNNE